MKPLDKSLLGLLQVHLVFSDNLIYYPDNVSIALTEHKCITAMQDEYIRQGNDGEREKTKRLVEVLMRRNVADYHKFVSLIKRKQPALANKLLDSKGKVFLTVVSLILMLFQVSC